MEALISSMIASGPVAKRPPHIRLLICRSLFYQQAMSQLLTMFSRIPFMGRLALVAAIALGAVSLYVSFGANGNPEPGNLTAASGATATCKSQADATAALAKAATGELAAFQAFALPRPLPALSFLDQGGKPVTLASLQGKAVLLNLWATWCAPCRKEMPALDALQAEFGGKDFEVVAINIDTRNLDRPRTWLEDNKITRLAYYSDPEAKVFQELKRVGQAIGMPTTLLIDASGCQLGVLHGPAEWHSEDARRLVRVALGR